MPDSEPTNKNAPAYSLEDRNHTRRGILKAAGTVGVTGGLAGCSGSGDQGEEPGNSTGNGENTEEQTSDGGTEVEDTGTLYKLPGIADEPNRKKLSDHITHPAHAIPNNVDIHGPDKIVGERPGGDEVDEKLDGQLWLNIFEGRDRIEGLNQLSEEEQREIWGKTYWEREKEVREELNPIENQLEMTHYNVIDGVNYSFFGFEPFSKVRAVDPNLEQGEVESEYQAESLETAVADEAYRVLKNRIASIPGEIETDTKTYEGNEVRYWEGGDIDGMIGMPVDTNILIHVPDKLSAADGFGDWESSKFDTEGMFDKQAKALFGIEPGAMANKNTTGTTEEPNTMEEAALNEAIRVMEEEGYDDFITLGAELYGDDTRLAVTGNDIAKGRQLQDTDGIFKKNGEVYETETSYRTDSDALDTLDFFRTGY